MARYRITSPVGVIDTDNGDILVTPYTTDDWIEYQDWLAAGNTPDAEAALPTQPVLVDYYAIAANGLSTSTISNIINPSNVIITMPPPAVMGGGTSEIVTDGDVLFTTTIAATYDFLIISEGYQDFTFSVVAS